MPVRGSYRLLTTIIMTKFEKVLDTVNHITGNLNFYTVDRTCGTPSVFSKQKKPYA